VTQAKLLAGCFALMAVISAAIFFVRFPDYGNAALAVLCGIAAYKIFKME